MAKTNKLFAEEPQSKDNGTIDNEATGTDPTAIDIDRTRQLTIQRLWTTTAI